MIYNSSHQVTTPGACPLPTYILHPLAGGFSLCSSFADGMSVLMCHCPVHSSGFHEVIRKHLVAQHIFRLPL